MKRLVNSPSVLVFLSGCMVILILLLRGLDIGPLHTDVIIHYAWFDEFGVSGFPDRYFDGNQRHPLVGPIIAFAYWLFGQHNIPYHLIFQLSRVLEGVFLAGIVVQITERRLLALCAGLVLMLIPIRLAELFQEIYWSIETTLAMLLASTYMYILYLKKPNQKERWYFFGISFACYTVSVLIYESGLPWLAVNVLAGWFVLDQLPPRTRFWSIARDTIPTALVAVVLAVAVVFVLKPWDVLKPEIETSSPQRLIEQLGTAVTFPASYVDHLKTARADGYLKLIAAAGLAAGAALALCTRLILPKTEGFPRDFVRLLLLSTMMLFCGVLVGTASPNLNHVYEDRITFARVTGIALLYVTLIFGACYLLRTRWYATLATVATGILLIGPSFTLLLAYQDYAQKTRQDIDHITNAALNVRPLMYSPVHIVVITLPNWPGAYFPDAVDVVVHEVQQKLWERGGDATIDIIKKGNASLAGEWETKPGSCDTVSGEAQAGMCLGADAIRLTRWSFGGWQPYENVVVVRYDHISHTMTIQPQISLSDLEDYNITTSGPLILRTNPERVTVPLE
jgi:hypothetical protein